MAAILTDDNFKCISSNENDRIPIRISLKYVPKGIIDNKSALVQVMAWRRAGDKPLPEPMLTQFTDAYAAQGRDELTNHYINGFVQDSSNSSALAMELLQSRTEPSIFFFFFKKKYQIFIVKYVMNALRTFFHFHQ